MSHTFFEFFRTWISKFGNGELKTLGVMNWIITIASLQLLVTFKFGSQNLKDTYFFYKSVLFFMGEIMRSSYNPDTKKKQNSKKNCSKSF